jgi:hypothetical protein
MGIRRASSGRIATIAAALALAGGALTATAATATAAPQTVPAGCGSGNFCFWNNANFNDGPGQVSGNNANFTVFSHSSCPYGTWNDCISSVYNNGTSGLGVNVYRDANYLGPSFCVSDNSGYAYLPTYYTNTTVVLNDSISSNKWTTAC